MAENQPEMDSGDAKPIALEEPQAAEAPVSKNTKADRQLRDDRGRGWLGLILGGAIAAGAGFAVAQFVPNGWPVQDTSAMQAAMDAQKQQIDALQSQLAALADRPVAPDLTDRVLAAEAAQEAVLAQIAELQSRSPAAESDPALALEIAALKEQISKIQTAAGPDTAAAEALLQKAQAAAEKIRADTEATAQKAEIRAALGRLQAALDSGAPYASAIPVLGEVPAVLTEFAESGVPSLAMLQNSFPEAARAALDAGIRSDMGDSWTERTLNFLRTQTGARSLTATEGTDPDAVLSRAEAALARNDLTAALTELDGLPPESQAAMTGWRTLAQQRQDAIKAAADLAAALEG